MEELSNIIAQSEIIIHTEPQGSPEWLEARSGKLTASHAKEIATAGVGMESYIFSMLEETIFGEKEDAFKGTKATERGIEKEPIARTAYSFFKSIDVQEVGFIQVGDFLGYSADGLIGKDGGIEIKCRKRSKHLRAITLKKLLPVELYQIQMTLMLSNRKWWDYVAYHPDFVNSLWIKRIEPDLKIQSKIAKGLIKGMEILQRITSTKEYQEELNRITNNQKP